jgi:hypothetical protein
MDVIEFIRGLERVWEAGSLPGRQNCEHNAAWRQLWRELQRPPASEPAAPLLRC